MQILLQHTGGKPIYEQIAEQMKAQILSGEIPAGEQLPSIRTLAKDLHISVITTKRAYEELEREGFITTVVGKGSFIKAADTRLLREENLKRIEEHFQEAIRIASESGVTRQELEEIFAILYEG